MVSFCSKKKKDKKTESRSSRRCAVLRVPGGPFYRGVPLGVNKKKGDKVCVCVCVCVWHCSRDEGAEMGVKGRGRATGVRLHSASVQTQHRNAPVPRLSRSRHLFCLFVCLFFCLFVCLFVYSCTASNTSSNIQIGTINDTINPASGGGEGTESDYGCVLAFNERASGSGGPWTSRRSKQLFK